MIDTNRRELCCRGSNFLVEENMDYSAEVHPNHLLHISDYPRSSWQGTLLELDTLELLIEAAEVTYPRMSSQSTERITTLYLQRL